jgi:hypothetical protein
LPPSRDAAWISAVSEWLDWSRNQLHARGALLAANLDWSQQLSQADLVAFARRVDVVVVEKGVWNPGATTPVGSQDSEYATCVEHAPSGYDLDRAWTAKFNTLRQIAIDRGLVLIGECLHESNLSPPLIQWAVANYLLVREGRTLLLLTGLKEPDSGRPFDAADLHIEIGSPVEAPREIGGLWTRRYQFGITAVNPSSSEGRILSLGTDRYKDLTGRLYEGSIEAPPKSGMTLMRQR